MGLWKSIAAGLVAWAWIACPAWAAAAGVEPSSPAGVTIWLSTIAHLSSPGRSKVGPVPSEARLATKQFMEELPANTIPGQTEEPPVLASAHVLAAIDGNDGSVVVFTREGDKVTRCGEVAFDPSGRPAKYKLVRDDAKKSLGVEVYSADDKMLSAVYLSPDGILEFRPPTKAVDAKASDAKASDAKASDAKASDAKPAEAVAADAKPATINVTPSGGKLKYGIVPSLMATDIVYSAQGRVAADAATADRWYLPSLDLFVGLVEGDDSMMVAAWPQGRQVPSLRMSGAANDRRIDGFSIQPAGGSFYLTFLAKPGIWHAEPLKPDYLEKDTVIAWKRPFEAKWIGRFYINSEEVDYPFYFRHDRAELWGRMIRSWFCWPVWFEEDETVIHFEKRYSPQGEMLIYYLEKHPDYPCQTAILSPVEVIEKALGEKEAARLLDLTGVEQRTVIPHGLCVCEMTATLQKHFDLGREVDEQPAIARYADDVTTFITNMRARLSEYRDFAAQTKELLKARAAKDAKLAAASGRLVAALDEFESAYRAGMPATSLDQVNLWTREFNALAKEAKSGNSKTFDAVAEKCRVVSGAQDDLARDLNVLATRLIEKAAQEAVASPEHAKLADEVIARARQVLRSPTVWEPRRHHHLQVDPGEPDLDPDTPD
jgi:hypothetical protein